MSLINAHLRRHRTTSGNWIPELDVWLRLIAILSVLLYHVHGQLARLPGLLHRKLLAIQPCSPAPLATAIAGYPSSFMVSGFILARPFAEHHLFQRNSQ